MSSTLQSAKAHRLYLLLRERILTGELRVSNRLPSEPELALAHDVSRGTIRRALEKLANDKLIERRLGSGTYVVGHDAETPPGIDFSNVCRALIDLGHEQQMRLHSYSLIEPTVLVANILKIKANTWVKRIVFTQCARDYPLAYHVAHVPELLPAELCVDLTSIADFEKYGSLLHADISATLADYEVAKALEIEVGSALLTASRTMCDITGRPLQHVASQYRPDLYSFNLNLTRPGSSR